MNILFLLLLSFITLGFLTDLVLDLLNISHIRTFLPELLTERYDSSSYRKSQVYLKEKVRFGIVVSFLSFLAIVLMLVLGGFAWLDRLVYSMTDHPVAAGLLFFGLAGFAAELAGIPFSLYSTFVIEEKFGFNKTTPLTFILDKLKSWLLTLLVGIPLLALIIWIYQLAGNWFWVIAWVLISGFSILLSFFYSTLIVPLFNKQVPLEPGELRTAIEELGRRAGFQLSKVFVINGSKRSTKANAYFAGFGNKRRIVLYDTLINDLSKEQILAVLAHEIGHYRKKHVPWSMLLSVVQTGLLLFLFSLIAGNPALSQSLQIANPSFHISVLVFGILFTPVSMVTGLLFNYLSRRFEYQADAFAAQMGCGKDLGDALIALSEKNLGNLTPHPAYVFVEYSHPPLLSRLIHLLPEMDLTVPEKSKL